MLPVARYRGRLEAELAAGFLLDAGIPAVVVADDSGGLEPALAYSAYAWVCVNEPDEPRARQLLRDLAPDGSDDGETG